MIKYKTKIIKNDLIIINNKGRTLNDNKEIIMSKKNAEKVFKVNLKGRNYSISNNFGDVEITFYNKGNIFGWLERISEKEFLKRCE